jgi:hypothetical protein
MAILRSSHEAEKSDGRMCIFELIVVALVLQDALNDLVSQSQEDRLDGINEIKEDLLCDTQCPKCRFWVR